MFASKCRACGASAVPIEAECHPDIFPLSNPTPILTHRDYAKLEAFCHLSLVPESVVRLQMETLLQNASIISAEEAAPNLVTLESIVRYRLGSLTAQSRCLVIPGKVLHMGASISIDTPLGLALLGRSVPNRVAYHGSRYSDVTLLELEFQQEREWRKSAVSDVDQNSQRKDISS